MHFDHSKRSYYRFPNKNSVTDIDTILPYYFPDKDSTVSNTLTDSIINSSNDDAHYNYPMKGDIL